MRYTDFYCELEQTHILDERAQREHIPTPACWCRPIDMGDNVWVHNDARAADMELKN